MKSLTSILLVLVICIQPVLGQSQNLRLFAYSKGNNAYSAWKSKAGGLPDKTGTADFFIEMEKEAPTADPSIAYIQIVGTQDRPVSFLTNGSGLSWEFRHDGHCGAISPHWYIPITGASGTVYKIALRCASARQTPGTLPGWTRATFTADDIAETIWKTYYDKAPDALAGKLQGLWVSFFTGTDQSNGYAYLDNVRVNDRIWTSPGD